MGGGIIFFSTDHGVNTCNELLAFHLVIGPEWNEFEFSIKRYDN